MLFNLGLPVLGEGVGVAPYIREGRYFRELLAAIFLTLLYRSLLFL